MPEENSPPPTEAKPETSPQPRSKPLTTELAAETSAGDAAAPARPPRPKPAEATTEAAEGEAPARPARAKPDAAPPKPLPEYLKEDLTPLLQKRMQAEGVKDVAISSGEAELTASWDGGEKTFTLYFDEGNLDGRKTISSSQEAKTRSRVVQMFMPPERGFKNVDAKLIVAMLMSQFTTTLTWIRKV